MVELLNKNSLIHVVIKKKKKSFLAHNWLTKDILIKVHFIIIFNQLFNHLSYNYITNLNRNKRTLQ